MDMNMCVLILMNTPQEACFFLIKKNKLEQFEIQVCLIVQSWKKYSILNLNYTIPFFLKAFF